MIALATTKRSVDDLLVSGAVSSTELHASKLQGSVALCCKIYRRGNAFTLPSAQLL